MRLNENKEAKGMGTTLFIKETVQTHKLQLRRAEETRPALQLHTQMTQRAAG